VVVVAYDDTGVVVVDWSGRSSRERETPCEIVLPFFFGLYCFFFFTKEKNIYGPSLSKCPGMLDREFDPVDKR
jgi:hypothetical protein